MGPIPNPLFKVRWDLGVGYCGDTERGAVVMAMAMAMAGGVQAGVSYVTKKELERRMESNRQRHALLPLQLIQRVNLCLYGFPIMYCPQTVFIFCIYFIHKE